MEQTLKFKTNINCDNCIAKVSPVLEASEKVKDWSVATDNPDKILTVSLHNGSSEDVKQLIQGRGFKIEDF